MENAYLFGNLRRSLDGTLEMKNLMDDIFASIPSGVITTDMHHQITVFNRSAERILGTPAFEVVGQPLWHVLPTIFPHIQAILEEGQICLNKEFSVVVPERGRVHLRLSCTPLRDAYGGIKGSTVVVHDLTEQRQVEAEREWIRQTLGRVVALRVRDRLLADPGNLRLDGIRQPITIMFADINQFTSFSERMIPENLFRLLNAYLSLAAQAVLEQEGTLDKFMGDAVMAFWNAPDTQPDHALRAVQAAVNITQAIHKLHAQLSPDRRLYFSVGINTGEAMVGNVGTSELFNYTVIGDTVNLAQRLEAVCRPGQILLTEATYRAVAAHVIARELPPVLLRGRQQPVTVYELEGLIGRPAISATGSTLFK
jgi:PAS domain S-box-containing protein